MNQETNKQKKDWIEEQNYFKHCRTLIGKNIAAYEKEYEERREEARLLNKAMKENPELYERFATIKSLEDQSLNQLRKNKAAYGKPYFGRIDYEDLALEKKEQIYIGKNGVFSNKTEVVVADWRAPISSVYYENELGKGSFKLNSLEEKQVQIELFLKRTYHIEKEELLGFYDSDVASNDELLVQYLSRNKDVILGEIIATIQKEQNEIIRESPFSNQIVQGVAGSGKTTVAMHRISYIIYNYKDRFTTNEFCVVGSNDLLLKYITSGLPELDVPDIKQMRMDSIFMHLLHKAWRKQHKLTEFFPDAKNRCDIKFMLLLDQFLLMKKTEFIPMETLFDKSLGNLLKESGNKALFAEQPSYSAVRLLKLMDGRVTIMLDSLKGAVDPEVLNRKKKEYKGYYKNKFPKETVYTLYEEFLNQEEVDYISEEHRISMRQRKYDIYDVAALVLIYYRIFQLHEDEEFGQIVIDEAQDFGSGLYYVLKTVLPKCYFTIMGDVSQNINYDTGMNDWEDLNDWFLTGQKDGFKLLSKSYRNTIEISDYAGKILEQASAGKYKINPVIRHGAPVEVREFWSEYEIAEYTFNTISRGLENDFATFAVVCREETDVTRIKELLSDKLEITDTDANGFAKGIVVLPIKMTKGLEFDMVFLWNPFKLLDKIPPMQAKLLYVAATRALHELHVMYH